MYALRNTFFQYGTDTRLNIGSPNAVLFKNTGAVKCWINNFPLEAGDTLTSNLLMPNMIDETQYNIKFDPTGTGVRLVNVIASFVNEIPDKKNGPAC